MATWDNPRDEVWLLRQEINQLIQQQNEQRQQMQRESQRRINDLEKQYRDEFQRFARETEAQYAERQRRLQEELLRVQRKELQHLVEYDRQLNEARQQKISRLAELCSQLKRELEEVQTKAQSAETMQRQEAEAQIRVTNEVYMRAECTAHDFFFPNKLALYNDELRRCIDFFGKSMYSAAAASAASAQISIEDLILDVRQKEQEWSRMFQDYRISVLHISATLDAFLKERQRTLFDEIEQQEGRLLDDELRDYWSSGMYRAVVAEVRAAVDLVARVDEAGVTSFLRQGSHLHERQLLNAISNNRELEDRLTAVMVSIRSEMRFSDERYVVGRLIEDLLVRMDYVVVRAGFAMREGVESPLDSYELTARLERAIIHIFIMPRRRNGIPVCNECLITVEMPNLPEATAYESFMNQWRQRINGALEMKEIGGITVMAHRADSHEVVAIRDLHRQMDPNPLEYAHRLALKY